VFSLEQRGTCVTLRGPEGLYSVYDPACVFTGMGWDAESASALLLGAAPRSALLLGYGGGTVARQLRLMFPRMRLTGVEIDAQIAGLAISRFGAEAIGATIVIGNGARFIRRSKRRYDFVLDDMWDHEQRRRRAILSDLRWLPTVTRRLTPRGLYAVNVFVDDCAAALRRMRRHFAEVTRVALPWERVCVLAGSRESVRPERIGRLLARLPAAIVQALGEVEFTSC